MKLTCDQIRLEILKGMLSSPAPLKPEYIMQGTDIIEGVEQYTEAFCKHVGIEYKPYDNNQNK